MITLVLEASTYAGSAALLEDGGLIAERSVVMRGREHEALMPAVAELLAERDMRPTSVGRVVCGAGPGSFTSLRIAGAIAKGIALAAGCPLIPVSSLALLVASGDRLQAGRYLAAVDALRGEHYVAPFEVSAEGTITALGPESRVASSEVRAYAESVGATAIGPEQHDPQHVAPHARGAARLSALIHATAPADLSRWEPAYGRLAEAQVKWEATHGRPLEAV